MHAVNHGLKHTYTAHHFEPPITGYPIYQPGGYARDQFFGYLKLYPQVAIFSDSLSGPGKFEVLDKLDDDKVTIHFK